MNIRHTLALAAGLLVSATPASAQLQIVAYGGGEWDLKDVSTYVLGVALQSTKLGWSPAFNILGYTVELPDTSAINRISAVNPSVGLQYRKDGSAFQARVGWAFVSAHDDIARLPSFGGVEDGLTTAVQYNYWGTGQRSFEAIGNMNWKDQYAFGRLRGTQKITGGIEPTGLSIGAELVGQGNEDYSAVQVGPIVQLSLGALKLLGGAGYKFQQTYEDTPYFRAEFVFIR